MKILGISAGTKNGNNDAMCKEALMEAKKLGAEVEFIRLLDLDLKHCTGCIACVKALMNGRGNICSLKDDFEWLKGKMLDADGIIFTVPIFEKGVAGIFKTVVDRFGPRMDRGNNVVAKKIAEENGGVAPDERNLKDKVISYIGIGGSDWTTRIQCDCEMLSLTPMWKTIDNEVFPWSKGIIMEDDKIKRVQEIGRNLTLAARDIENATFKGDSGVCPHCHSRNFYVQNDGSATCCLCGIVGKFEINETGLKFIFPEEQLEHAHNTLSGKFIHMNDIKTNESKLMEAKKTEEYKTRLQKYKDFIVASTPEK